MKQLKPSLCLLALILIGALLPGCSAKQNPSGIPTTSPSFGPAASLPAEASTALPTSFLVSTPAGQAPLISMDLAASRSSLSSVSSLVWLPGDQLAVAAQEEVALVDLPSPDAGPQAVVSIQSTHESDQPLFLSASRDGEDLAWISSETSIQFWNPSQMEDPKVLGSSSTPVTGIAVQPGGDRMAAATLHGEITQLSTRAEESPLTWQAPAWLSNLSYSPDGARLGGVDLATFTVYIFSLDGIVQQKLEWTSSASSNLYGAYFSPDWSRIAWAARGAVQIIEIPSG